MKPDAVNTKNEKVSIKQEFFFAGGGEYKPCTIEANSIEEATALYVKQREAIN